MSEQPSLASVLVVDDDPFALNVLARQIALHGARSVTTCAHPHEALALIGDSSADVDVVFCDLQMPDIDGVQFVRELARTRFAGALVLVSGEDGRILQTAERLAMAHGLRVLGALRKPASQDTIRGVLARLDAKRGPAPRSPRRVYRPDELRAGLARGELMTHYQPKIDLATGAIAGMETLVRWQHPEDGLVFPDQFVPTAEQSGLIVQLTAAVLAAALFDAARWRAAGLALHVAVNVSIDDLGALDFPDFVTRTAEEAGVPVSDLVLEITESRLMTDTVMPLDILTRLRLRQVGLSIDDFGTGHSSLANLRDIPFNELKVDRGFVHGACRDASLRAIVDASLSMARQLGMRTVGEGVEDRDDLQFLRAAGCDMAQGYHLARPMPSDDVIDWVRRWQPRDGQLAAPGAVPAWHAGAACAAPANSATLRPAARRGKR